MSYETACLGSSSCAAAPPPACAHQAGLEASLREGLCALGRKQALGRGLCGSVCARTGKSEARGKDTCEKWCRVYGDQRCYGNHSKGNCIKYKCNEFKYSLVWVKWLSDLLAEDCSSTQQCCRCFSELFMLAGQVSVCLPGLGDLECEPGPGEGRMLPTARRGDSRS